MIEKSNNPSSINNCNNRIATSLIPLLPKKKNSVMSPYGIKAVLSMAAEGASGESLNEILSVLGMGSLDEVRKTVFALYNDKVKAFTIANSLKLCKGKEKLELQNDFRRTIKEDYKAVIEEEDSNDLAKLTLTNNVQFKAKWLVDLNIDKSSGIRTFSNADGSTSLPVFLKYEGKLIKYCNGYAEEYGGERIKAVALPYKFNGSAIPYELILIDTRIDLTEDSIAYILDNLHYNRKFELTFPEFTIKGKYDLVPVMKQLGLKRIFDDGIGELNKIATEPLYVNKFEQEAEIIVDRVGTVARAKTSMDMMTLCMPEISPEVEFVDPFHYILRNTTNGEILFVGKVNKLEDAEIDRSIFDESEETPKAGLLPWIDFAQILKNKDRKPVAEEDIPEITDSDGVLSIRRIKSAEINVPEGIRIIDRNSILFDKENLEYINLPESLEWIDDEAFRGCKNLKRIVIPANVQRIGRNAFVGCVALEDIVIKGNPEFNEDVFDDTPWKKKALENTDALIVGNKLLAVRADVTEYTIPENVKVICRGAFQNTMIKRVIVSEGVQKIGDQAFHSSKLEYISLPKTLRNFGSSPFGRCKYLREVVILEELKRRNGRAFCNLPNCSFTFINVSED